MSEGQVRCSVVFKGLGFQEGFTGVRSSLAQSPGARARTQVAAKVPQSSLSTQQKKQPAPPNPETPEPGTFKPLNP